MPGTVRRANWPASNVERVLEIDVERGHVVGQPTPAAHPPWPGGGGRGARLAGPQHGDLERAGLARHALAHQEIGRFLEVAVPRGLGPLALHPAAHEPGLAGAAGAGAALVRQLEAAPEAGVEDLLPGLALELARPAPGGDDDLHRRLRPACRPRSGRGA